MNIMTWNVLYKTEPNKLLHELDALVGRHDIDVLALQELRRWQMSRPLANLPLQIAERLGMHAAVALHPVPYGWWWEGVGIFSRWPILEWQRVRLNPYRAYLEATVQPPGAEAVKFVCVHLSLAWWHSRELNRILATQTAERTVLLGDFNLVPESRGVRDILLDYCSDNLIEPTCGSRKIDYIFVSPHLRLRSSRTLNTHLSDHRPIFAKIS